MLVATNLYHTSLRVLEEENVGVEPAKVPLVAAAPTVNEIAVAVVSLAAVGAGTLKPDEVAPVRPVPLNEIVAPDTAAALVAVSPEKVAVPLTAATVTVPPRVHVPCTAAAVTLAVLVVVFP